MTRTPARSRCAYFSAQLLSGSSASRSQTVVRHDLHRQQFRTRKEPLLAAFAQRQIRQRRTVRFHLEESAMDHGAAGKAEVERERREVAHCAWPQVKPKLFVDLAREAALVGLPRLDRAAEAAPVVGKEDRGLGIAQLDEIAPHFVDDERDRGVGRLERTLRFQIAERAVGGLQTSPSHALSAARRRSYSLSTSCTGPSAISLPCSKRNRRLHH